MNYYILGIIFGILFALSIAFISWSIHRKVHPNSGKYDERQLVGRGKAFQAGFFTTLIACAGVSIWEYTAGGLPGEAFLWHIGALFVGVLVYALTAIHYDAYVGIYDSPARFIRMGVIFVAAMALCGIANLSTGRQESMTIAYLNLAIAVMWVIIVAALLLHRRKLQQEDEE